MPKPSVITVGSTVLVTLDKSSTPPEGLEGVVVSRKIHDGHEVYDVNCGENLVVARFDDLVVKEMAPWPEPECEPEQALIYAPKSGSPLVFFAPDEDGLDAAFLALFRYFDGEYWDFYSEVPKKQLSLLNKARGGDAKAARKLMEIRRSYEYEYWDVVDLLDPTTANTEEF